MLRRLQVVQMLAHPPDRDQKAAIKMDLEIPADNVIKKTENNTFEKYQGLQEELEHMWLVNFKKKIIPVVKMIYGKRLKFLFKSAAL